MLAAKLAFNLSALLLLSTNGSAIVTKWEEKREKIIGILFTLFRPQRPLFPTPLLREKAFLSVLGIRMLAPCQECVLLTQGSTQYMVGKLKEKKERKGEERTGKGRKGEGRRRGGKFPYTFLADPEVPLPCPLP